MGGMINLFSPFSLILRRKKTLAELFFTLSLGKWSRQFFTISRQLFLFLFFFLPRSHDQGRRVEGKKWKDSTVWEDGGGNQQYYTIYIFIWLKCNWRNSFHILPNNICERGQDPYFEVTLQVGRGKCGRKKKERNIRFGMGRKRKGPWADSFHPSSSLTRGRRKK